MHPLLTALLIIVVPVGSWASWTIGWNFSDWVRRLFTPRVPVTKEYIVYDGPTSLVHESVIDEFNLDTQQRMNIKGMKWGLQYANAHEKMCHEQEKLAYALNQNEEDLKRLTNQLSQYNYNNI